MFDFAFDPTFDVGRTPFQAALERRLRARAARADCDVELTPELLHRWMREELEALRRDHEFARCFAKYRIEN